MHALTGKTVFRFALASFLSVLVAFCSPSEVTRLLAEGRLALNNGQLAQAKSAIETAVEVEPGNAQANYELGLLLGRLGNAQGAEASFRRAISVRPDWPEAQYNLGLALVADTEGKKGWPAAAVAFKEALRLRPGYSAAHVALASALSELGETAEAMAEYRRAIELDKTSWQAHLQLGRLLEQGNQAVEAEAQFRLALQLNPESAPAGVALAKLLLARHPPAAGESLEVLRKLLRADPDNQAGQYTLARALRLAGNSVDAGIALRQSDALAALRQKMVQSDHLSNAGLDAARKGDRESALRDLREAVSLRPDAALAHFNLGLILADSAQLAAAQSQIVQAISLAPAESRFYLSLGRLYLRAGAFSEARDALQVAGGFASTKAPAAVELKKLPETAGPVLTPDIYRYGAPSDTADGHFAFGTLLAQRNDWLGAAGEWLRTLAIRPAHVDARNNLGISYTRLNRSNDAELEFYKSLQTDPDSAGARLGLAAIYMDRGDKLQASSQLREVLRVQPGNTQAQQLLSLASK